MTIAFVAAGLPLLAGFESEAPNSLLLAGTGSELAQVMHDAGVAAATVDQNPDAPVLREPVLTSALVLEHFQAKGDLAEHGVAAVVAFKPSVALERTATDCGVQLLSASAQLVRQLENKLALPTIAAAAGVTAPEAVAVRVDQHRVEMLASSTRHLPAVFQPAMSFAGAGTVALHDMDDVERLLSDQAHVAGKIATLIAGEPVTVSGVACADGPILVGPVARQLTGIPQLTAAPYGSCGNEWSIPVPAAHQQCARDVCSRVGQELVRRGFIGTFGVDLVLTREGDAVLIEINPRITASLAFQAQLQRQAQLPTLMEGHLAAFGFNTHRLDDLRDAWGSPGAVPELGPAANVLVFNREAAACIPADLPTGVWQLEGERAVWKRAAWRIDHVNSPDEFLVIGSSPHRPVAPGAALLRIATPCQAAADADCRELNEPTRAVVSAMQSH